MSAFYIDWWKILGLLICLFFSHAWNQFGGLLNDSQSLEFFAHDWICCEHTSGRLRWLIFFFYYAVKGSLWWSWKNNNFWQKKTLKTEKMAAIFVSLSFTSSCVWLLSFLYLTMCTWQSILRDRHAVYELNMNMRHTENHKFMFERKPM